LYGARVSLTVGFGAMAAGGLLSTLFGGLSGFLGGWVDAVLQRIVDACLSIPALIMLMTLLSILGTTLWTLIAVLSVWSIVSSARTVRSAVIVVLHRPYVDAARAVGVSPPRLFLRHVMPNIAAPCIVVSTLIFVYAVLTEAALSFLGFGVRPPTATWGGMLSGDSRALMLVAPWIGLAPGVALSVVVIAVNLLGDGLRDVMDPSLRVQ
jgi:peptide/nickel transport system permease protein